jgi:hypothetical protein
VIIAITTSNSIRVKAPFRFWTPESAWRQEEKIFMGSFISSELSGFLQHGRKTLLFEKIGKNLATELTFFFVWHKLTDMKTLSTRHFTREFSKVRHEPWVVTESGKVIGTWTPMREQPEAIDFAARVRLDFSKPLPFTGTQLLKAGKKR